MTTTDTSSFARSRTDRFDTRTLVVLAALLTARLLLLLTPSLVPHGSLPGSASNIISADTTRYHQIATETGTPYRDFPVEYPPLALGVIKAIDSPNVNAIAGRLVVISLVADVGICVLLVLEWGIGAGIIYLALSAP